MIFANIECLTANKAYILSEMYTVCVSRKHTDRPISKIVGIEYVD